VEVYIYGQDDTEDYRKIEMMLAPCQEDTTTNTKCNKSKDKLIEYLGPLDFMVLYNNQRVDPLDFKTPIVNELNIKNRQVNEAEPNFIHSKIIQNMFEDDSSYYMTGFENTTEFWSFNYGQPQVSAWREYPEKYKISGMEILFSYD